MGTDTEFCRSAVQIEGQTQHLARGGRTFDVLDLSKRRSGGPSRLGAQTWGQTRCPICRSGTFNVKRSTLNFQRGDRKGAWWRGYGDRHGVLPVGGANRGTDTTFGPGGGRTFDLLDLSKRRSDGPSRAAPPSRDMGTDTMSDIPIRNVQRETFNSQLSMG